MYIFYLQVKNPVTGMPHTHKAQPDELQPDHCNDSEGDPEERLQVERHPEESRVGGVDGSHVRVRRFKHPMAGAILSVDLVPPSQTDQPPAGDVLEVVEVRGEKKDGDDEDEDAGDAEGDRVNRSVPRRYDGSCCDAGGGLGRGVE